MILKLRMPSAATKLGLSIALIAFVSPILVIIGWPRYGEPHIFLLTVIVDYQYNRTIRFHDPWEMFQYLPFVIFRFLFAFELKKYYEGKSTIERIVLAGLLGELPAIIMNLSIISTELFVAPLPLHIFVGIFIILVKPPIHPLTSWSELHDDA